MPEPGSAQRFTSPIMQNGYAVRDWEEAARHWSSVLGVGPFFALRHIEFEWCEFRGRRVQPDLTVAIAYSGGHQIELVQQHNDAPSIFTEFLARNPPGLQHVGALVDDLDATLDGCGFRDRIVQHGVTTAGMRFAYVDTVLHDGSMLELIESNPAALEAFSRMRRAAEGWDGSRPVRG